MVFIYRTWRIARWILLAGIIGYICLVAYRIPAVHQEEASQSMVANIEAQRLAQADVDGTDLPPSPDPTKNGASLVGIDANGNGIRDDVELAVFAEYPTSSPTSTPVRAAELQYAMDLQMEFTDVFDSATLVAVMRQEGRGFMCVPTEEETDYVENLVFNTTERRDYREGIYKKYMTSFKLDSSDFCDLTF